MCWRPRKSREHVQDSNKNPVRSDSEGKRATSNGSVEVSAVPPGSSEQPSSGGLPSSESCLDVSGGRKGRPIFLSKTVPNETKPELVQNRLVPVIKGLFELESLNKTGGTSDLLAEKIAQKNKLDEAPEQTCEDDCNYTHIRKDILAMVEKSSRPSKEDDTQYDHRRKSGKSSKERTTPPSKKEKVVYQKDTRQIKSKEEKKAKSAENGGGGAKDFDSENDVNERNYMYNLKEIEYCSHGILRCIEEDNLAKLIADNCRLPEKVEPYGDLEQLAKRRYSTCKVLRRNTLISTLLSMPSADEKEKAATATAKHMTDSAIRFLPPATLQSHCEDAGREDHTFIDASDIVATGTGGTGGTGTGVDHTAVAHDHSKRKTGTGGTGTGVDHTAVAHDHSKRKHKKDKAAEKTCEEVKSEKKTAEEL